jgi:hypothetical protein
MESKIAISVSRLISSYSTIDDAIFSQTEKISCLRKIHFIHNLDLSQAIFTEEQILSKLIEKKKEIKPQIIQKKKSAFNKIKDLIFLK